MRFGGGPGLRYPVQILVSGYKVRWLEVGVLRGAGSVDLLLVAFGHGGPHGLGGG